MHDSEQKNKIDSVDPVFCKIGVPSREPRPFAPFYHLKLITHIVNCCKISSYFVMALL